MVKWLVARPSDGQDQISGLIVSSPRWLVHRPAEPSLLILVVVEVYGIAYDDLPVPMARESPSILEILPTHPHQTPGLDAMPHRFRRVERPIAAAPEDIDERFRWP